MSRRNPNARLVKIHRNYTIDEAAKTLGVHRNTVRQWIKQGLPTCDGRRPILVLGKHLVAFLQARRVKNKQSCKPGEMYCIRCRIPQYPAGDMADYEVISLTMGNLVGICPQCDLVMNRRVNFAKLHTVRGNLDVVLPLALRHIDDCSSPSLNSDFATAGQNHARAQP